MWSIMHTVFINTTENKIGGRFDSLKNAKDLKKLMYVDCPFPQWSEEEGGYRVITEQIATFIDTFNNVTNDYNLVVYVDLLQYFDLLKIDFFAEDDVEQIFLSELCKSAVARIISTTILKKLEEEGRRPTETTLLLELPKTKELQGGIDVEQWKFNALLKSLGLVSMELLQKKLISGAKDSRIQIADLYDESKKDARLDLLSVYEDKIQLLVDSVCIDGVTLPRACRDLYDSIEKQYHGDLARNLAVSEYFTNKKTKKLSLEVFTKHNFLVQCYIADCIKDGSTLTKENQAKQIQELSDEEWKAILKELYKKKRRYESARQKIADLSMNYTALGLAPHMYQLLIKKFGLNENGNVKSEYVIREVEEDQENKPEKEEGSRRRAAMRKREELSMESGVVVNWFDENTYTPYDTTGEKFTSKGIASTAAEYIDKARDLANHHANLFDKLSSHIVRAMANYAGYSKSNLPPILRKRKVNHGEDISDSAKNDYMYAGGADKKVDDTPTESLIRISKRAYVSIMLEYLKFDAGRGLAIADIKKQCDWFIERVKQIEESLKKLKWILIVLSVTLAVVYLPFLLIQWDLVTKNVDTLLVAGGSLALPYAFLFLCYAIAREVQKKKMKKAWEDLLEQSDKACKENREMIKAYDSMMTKYIPALRWLYEYVLDVDFHCDCCDIARAKLAHHRDKLFELIENLGNFLEDLDYKGFEYAPSNVELEYQKAFCEGKNKEFYSIIDQKILDMVQRREEEAN